MLDMTEYLKNWRKRNAERVRNYRQKSWQKRSEQTKEWLEKNGRSQYRETQKRATARWRARNPGAASAHSLLNYAVKTGKIVKPSECQNCGSAGRINAHHEDYSRPYDVLWLCQTCHRRNHTGHAIPAA